METIKEKAEEYANEQDLRMAYNGSCDNCQQGFVTGANYVLDAIEECFNPKDDIVTQWGAIATLIEQLKSNQ